MLERHIQTLVTDDTTGEAPAATRERLKGNFPVGATRRMTNLGLLVGSALARLGPQEDDSVVYATGYAESCALEGFLDSFPTPSPTLFQTSIHPSAVQQLMIGVAEIFVAADEEGDARAVRREQTELVVPRANARIVE